ncbi:DUF484 family protein [Reinekea marinisedimentorum]|uniref:DUF484 family protein n=1 Tax=Reinekea marinisedimentorum TaxID=230495 RepID=A0A4R3ICV3_9GAMM|nr:DUF484 family protein [Reinekea marinisedimentorum]TCS44015.1 hypothetical protein BCF53_101358 [Reinekea marinisedimentorum]
MTELTDELSISEEEVVRYLRLQPHFFEDHPNLLKSLHLKHDSGDAISLIERQNHILRKENNDLIDRLNHFINVAQRNDNLFMKLQKLVLELIACRTLNDISKVLNQVLTERFDVDQVQLVLTHQQTTDGDLWLYCDREILNTHFRSTITELKNQCGEFSETSRQLLFAESEVKSVALGAVTLNGKGIGLIALGSHSASHFRSSTDTLFLGHLANVISQLLARF